MDASGRVRRLGFGAAAATGLTLIAMSFSGMANLDDQLQAAAEQPPGVERVSIDTHDWCERDRERQQRRSISGDA